MDRGVLVYTLDPTLYDSPILARTELTLMPKNNLNEVPQIFPHTIAITNIEHPKAAFDLIKWCMTNFQSDWHKILINDIIYIQMADEQDLTLFLLYWSLDSRIDYTVIDIISELGL